MDELFAQMWTDLTGRLTGPMTFRFILQPTMAAIYAVRDGIKDARNDEPAYFWSILTNPSEGVRLLAEGWRAVLRVILLGSVMDLIYQWLVFRRFHPLQLVIVVFTLAFLPYLLLRGPANRIARHWPRSQKAGHL